jgi:uroporphyrin-III C-methyltransferase
MSNERKDEIVTTQLVDAKKKFRFSWVNIGILCSAFSIVVLIVIGSYSYWYLITANTQLAKLAIESQSQLQQLQADFSVVQKNVNATQQMVQQFADDIKNLKQTVSDVSQVKQDNQEKWLLAEARYFVKLANDNLQFARDIPLAITLLKRADQEISQLVNPKLTEIRKVIAMDIANLQNAPQVDVVGLYMKLTALNSQLDQLPLLNQQINLQEKKSIVAAEQKSTWWQRGLYVSITKHRCCAL